MLIFCCCSFDENSVLIVSVFDWDYGKSDDFIGATQVELNPLHDYKERDQWLGLTKLKKSKEKVGRNIISNLPFFILFYVAKLFFLWFEQFRGEIHLKFQLKNTDGK